MTQMVARHTSMSINNYILVKVPVWQGFSGRNRFKFHPPTSAAPASGFLLTALSNARPNAPFLPTPSCQGASDKALT
jgi:hypothetical protein